MLDKIVQAKYEEVAAAKAQRPLNTFIKNIVPGKHAFRKALKRSAWTLIAECKLASPVKGQLCKDYTVSELAGIYTANGATALSVLTDKHFNGCLGDIAVARSMSNLPILRKDFVVDTYQVYEARAVGADAILLIAAVLDDDLLKECLDLAHKLGMDCLVEVHTEEELLRVLKTDAKIIGINNRNLKTFVTDIDTTRELLPLCRKGRMVISESGFRTAEDAEKLRSWGAKGILVGEGLVTAPDIAVRTKELALID